MCRRSYKREAMNLRQTCSLLAAAVATSVAIAGAGLSGPAIALPAVPPELPRALVDTSEPAMTGRTLRVAEGGDLQAALGAANPGDTIVLDPGAEYRGPFTLPAKTGSGWIEITGDPRTLPAPGLRIDPSFDGWLPKLVAASGPILSAPHAGRYRFIGIEITPEAGRFLTSLVSVTAPERLVFDRCYIHGDAMLGARRGVALNGGAAAVINSYISDIKMVGEDSQAIAGWNGTGPYAILNNHLEASGENVMFGGADPSVRDLVPADIEVRRNHFTKPLSWRIGDRSYAGTPWTVKNLLELKNARRVLIDGNIFEYNWPQAQNGFAVLFTVRNQDGRAPWSAVEDVTFSNNIIRHVAEAVNLLGTDDLHQSQQTRRLLIRNNLFEDVGGAWGRGILFQLINGAADVVVDHNTATQTNSFVSSDLRPHERFVFRNNIVLHNLYGLVGSGAGTGLTAIEHYFPGAVVLRNAIVGGDGSQYPKGNSFPASLDKVGFVDRHGHNYRLAPASSLRNAGTDGHDLGADITALTAAT